MKLHVGCGTVYLDGWTNLDNETRFTFLAEKRPDLVERWKTTEDNYYGRHQNVTKDSVGSGTVTETVCDVFGDICSLPIDTDSVDEILCRQVFEHLSIREARQALCECNRVLKRGGVFRLDVPDFWESLEQYRKTGDVFFKRHLVGSQKCDSAWHVMGWDRNSLGMMARQYGFIVDSVEPNIHFYPAFCVRLKKIDDWDKHPVLFSQTYNMHKPWKAAWEYCGDWWDRTPGRPLKVPNKWYCLEVGPGRHPWNRANLYVEPNYEFAQDLPHISFNQPLETAWRDIPGGCVDFAYCSHVAEHVDDPAQFTDCLVRCAKRGLIVCPSPMIDTLFAYHEPDHKWWVQNLGGELVFKKVPDYVKNLSVMDMQKAAHRLWRLGSPNLGLDGIHARKWYHLAEPFLNTYLWWEDTIPFKVIS